MAPVTTRYFCCIVSDKLPKILRNVESVDKRKCFENASTFFKTHVHELK